MFLFSGTHACVTWIETDPRSIYRITERLVEQSLGMFVEPAHQRKCGSFSSRSHRDVALIRDLCLPGPIQIEEEEETVKSARHGLIISELAA